MGVFPGARLAYGVELYNGGEWYVEEADDIGFINVPWTHKETPDAKEDIVYWLVGGLIGMTEAKARAMSAWAAADYLDEQTRLRVIHYGNEFSGFFLACGPVHEAGAYTPVMIEQDTDWTPAYGLHQITWALKRLGLTPTNPVGTKLLVNRE